jgi:hypothetical protein
MVDILKRWHRKPFELLDVPFTVEVKALTFAEAPAFLRPFDKLSAALAAGDSEGVYAALAQEWVGEAFVKYVRRVEGLRTEDADVTSGAQLLEQADIELVFKVLAHIKALAFSPGKASGSPSTSPSAPPAGESTAPPASASDGTEPATAQETPATDASSGPQE